MIKLRKCNDRCDKSGLFNWVRILFIVSMLTSLTACSTIQNTLFSSQLADEAAAKRDSSKVVASNNGFGGTGRALEAVTAVTENINPASLRHTAVLDNGFGGTGQTASGFGGTGFIGTIQKFGSIWVNGVEVGIGQQTELFSNTGRTVQPLSVKDLRIGQQVWFETQPSQDKTTTAKVHVFYPLAGKIEAIKTQDMATELVVNGQRVYISSQTVIPDTVELEVGESIRISGLPVYAKVGKAENKGGLNGGQTKRRLQRTNAWEATLIEANVKGQSWFNTVPNTTFSEGVNRVMMDSRWGTSYELGEFKNLKSGLSSQPKIKVMGQEEVGKRIK